MTPGTVVVHHPGYTNPPAAILRLSAYDQVVPLNGAFGVNHRVMLDACFVLANNKEGYLLDSQHECCALNQYPVLPAGSYWYEVAANHLYPIVDDFRVWSPPSQLPDHWLAIPLGLAADEDRILAGIQSGSKMATRVKTRDTSRCVLSRLHRKLCLALGHTSCSRLYPAAYCLKVLKNAHLVPTAKAVWFNTNAQAQHNAYTNARISDVRNGITLQADLHAAMDAQMFTPASVGSHVVAFFLWPELDMVHEYHRVPSLSWERHCHTTSSPGLLSTSSISKL